MKIMIVSYAVGLSGSDGFAKRRRPAVPCYVSRADHYLRQPQTVRKLKPCARRKIIHTLPLKGPVGFQCTFA